MRYSPHLIQLLLGCLVSLCIPILIAPAGAQPLSSGDKLNLEVAMAITRKFGTPLWPDMAEASYATILIAPEERAFVCFSTQPSDTVLYEGKIAGCKVHTLPTDFNSERIQAVTVLGREPMVIIGSPYTAEVFPLWVGIWLHEHFHQYQMQAPGYQVSAEALGLADEDDQSGQWMVTFDFPFDQPAVQKSFTLAANKLHAVMTRLEKPDEARTALRAYLQAKKAFHRTVGSKAARWASFVSWQEGLADAFEITMLEAVGGDPSFYSSAVSAESFGRLAAHHRADMLAKLDNPDLAGDRRLAFYTLGAAEALTLDALVPEWRSAPENSRFDLNPLLQSAVENQGPRG